MTSTATASSPRTDSLSQRRARGVALIVGAGVIVALIETGTLAFYWFPVLLGLTYLTAAVVGRSSGTLWAPALVTTSVGLAVALWLRDGRSVGSYQLLALAAMALGLGGVLAALLAQVRGLTISAMSVSVAVLLFGVFALLDQQGVRPVSGQTWVYAGLLIAWGAWELRPTPR